MGNIFAFEAKFVPALITEEGTINTLRLVTNVAVAERIPIGIGKVITVPAANLTDLEHFAVCAFLFGARRHPTQTCPSSVT
jgi:hypothetical protein